MTDQEIALKWLASGTWKQDVETARMLSIVVSTLRDYGAIKAELSKAKEDNEFINEAANVLHSASESLHAEVKRLQTELDRCTSGNGTYISIESHNRLIRDARNELCLKCGRYHEAHKGACNGCKWEWRGVVEE